MPSGPVVTTFGDSVCEVGHERVASEKPDSEVEIGAEGYRFARVWE